MPRQPDPQVAERRRQVARLAAQGWQPSAIAAQWNVSEATIANDLTLARKAAAERVAVVAELEGRGFSPRSLLALLACLPIHELQALGRALATGKWDHTAKRAGQRRLDEVVGL